MASYVRKIFDNRALLAPILSLLSLASPVLAFAEIDVPKTICNIAGYMQDILFALSAIMIIYAAYLYLTASGDANKINTAHKTIAYAAVAIIVALLARTFPSLIAGIVSSDQSINDCSTY